jgi:hypothetical protein
MIARREPSEALRSLRYPLNFDLNVGNAGRQTITLQASASEYLVLWGWSAAGGGRFVAFPHDERGINYASAAVERAIMFGSRVNGILWVYEYPIPLVIPPNTQFFLDLEDKTGALPNTGQIVAHLWRHTDLARPPKIGYQYRKVPILGPKGEATGQHREEPLDQVTRNHPYLIVANAVLAAADEQPLDIKNPTGAEAVIHGLRAFATDYTNGGAQTVMAGILADSWDNGAVRLDTGWGGAEQMYPFPAGRLLKSGNIVTTRVKDLTGLGVTVQLALDGVRRYGASRV